MVLMGHRLQCKNQSIILLICNTAHLKIDTASCCAYKEHDLYNNTAVPI